MFYYIYNSKLYWIHYIVIYLFINLFSSIQRIYNLSDFLISFSKFSDVLPALTWAGAIYNLWSIFSGVNILSPLPLIDL